MQFLNHPITLTCMVTLAFVLPITFLIRGLKWFLNNPDKTDYTESKQDNSNIEKEDFPNGCEIMLKAARGELPRAEYDKFCQERERIKNEKRRRSQETGKTIYRPERKIRRFESPQGW